MKNSKDYYSIISEYHSTCCACEQCINWNVHEITCDTISVGFIVQKYERILYPNNVLKTEQYNSASYFEAWLVKNNRIAPEDEGERCNDAFCIGNPLEPIKEFYKSIQTKGKFVFSGTVFWVPENTSLFSAINEWPRSNEQAKELRSVDECLQLEQEKCVFKRNPFIHSWDLTDNKKIFESAKKMLFKYCPDNTSKDRALLSEGLAEMFHSDAQYESIVKQIEDEWENRCSN